MPLQVMQQPDHKQQYPRMLFEKLISQSKSMYRYALNGDWENVSAIEIKRQLVMQQCFAEPATAEDSEKIAVAIYEVLRLNQEISDLGEQSRHNLLNSLQTHKQSKHACKAYLDNS